MTSPVTIPDTAMILAAGKGLRMRPITDSLPKPLVMVRGERLIDRVVAKLVAGGIKNIVVNMSWHADMLEDHLNRLAKHYPDINFTWSDERDLLLETGGGVTKALRDGLLPNDRPFFVVNSDIVWRDGPANCFLRMARRWTEEDKALLLLQATAGAIGYTGQGDFFLSEDGTPVWRGNAMVAPFIYTGIQLLHPDLFASAQVSPWSLVQAYDDAIENRTLRGLLHDGDWMDAGSLDSLRIIDNELGRRGYAVH